MTKKHAIKSAALALPLLLAFGCETVPRCPQGSEYNHTSRNCTVDAAMGAPVDAAVPDAFVMPTDSGPAEDAGTEDAGAAPDAGPADAGRADAGRADAGAVDAAT